MSLVLTKNYPSLPEMPIFQNNTNKIDSFFYKMPEISFKPIFKKTDIIQNKEQEIPLDFIIDHLNEKDEQIYNEIALLSAKGGAFDFLEDDEVEYSEADLIELY